MHKELLEIKMRQGRIRISQGISERICRTNGEYFLEQTEVRQMKQQSFSINQVCAVLFAIHLIKFALSVMYLVLLATVDHVMLH